jgi:hypothetical protein
MRIVMLLLGGAGLAAVRACVQPLKLCVRTERICGTNGIHNVVDKSRLWGSL